MANNNLTNIESEVDMLKIISKCKNKYRKAIIKSADRKLISAICECILNSLKGNVKIDPKTRQYLYKYKNVLRKLVSKSTLQKKKQILDQKGGFLPVLLTSILPTIIWSLAAYLGSKQNK